MIVHQAITSQRLLTYAAAHFDTYCYLNGNNISYPHGAFPTLMGLAVAEEYLAVTAHDFSWEAMDLFIQRHRGKHIFSYINYGLKNHIEQFSERSTDPLAFPLIHLYVPRYLFVQEDDLSWKAYDKKSEELIPALLTKPNDHSSLPQQPQATAPLEEQWLVAVEVMKNDH